MTPTTALTDADFQQHPLAREAFQWRQQHGRETINVQLQNYREYIGTEEYKMLEALDAIPAEEWPRWEEAIGK